MTVDLYHIFAAELLVILGIFLVTVISAGICLSKERGVDRLTWLVAIIGIPIVGAVLYFLMRDEFGNNPNVSEEWKEEMRRLKRGG